MKSYLKFLSRNGLYTAIEAAGLAVSLAFVIIISCFAAQEWGIAHEHRDGGRIVTANMPDYPGLTYGFAEHLSETAPEVELASRWCPGIEGILTCAGESFSVRGAATDPQFFEVFPRYRFVEGGPEALGSRSNILVSSSFAAQLPWDDPVGKGVEIGGESYVIAGIVEDFRRSVFPSCDILVPVNSELNRDSWSVPYDHYGSTVPIMRLREGADREEFTAKVERLCKELYPQFYGQSFFGYVRVLSMNEMYFANLQNFNGGDRSRLLLLFGIGLLLLLSAVFNYINLSFALTAVRAREMATRRLVGATKGMIFGKYIAESLLFTAVCTGAALLLAISIAPTLSSLMASDIRIVFTPGSVVLLLGLIAVVGVVCGFVPALAASRYEPIDVVRGTARAGNKRIFSKVFIVFQGALAVFMISMAIVTEAQYRKSLSRPMHANVENRFFLMREEYLDLDSYMVLYDRLMSLPAVKRIGFSNGVPGTTVGGQFCTSLGGDEILSRTYWMDSTAFSIIGFEKLEDYGAPIYRSVWFGQRCFNAMGYTSEYHDLTNLKQRMGGVEQTAGVIADFPVNASNMGAEDNLMVIVTRKEHMGYAGLLIETADMSAETANAIRSVYDGWCVDFKGVRAEPKYASFIGDIFRDALAESHRQMRLIEIFMAVAVLLSLLGLLAMSTWYAALRRRDIAVRKVFGSTVARETWGSVALYMWLVAVSCVVGVPVAVWAAARYLQDYICRIERYWWIFALAVLLAVTAAFLSVLWQTLRAATTNPASELKKE